MKKILITGKNSYVGTKFMEWVSQWPDEYQVDAISVRGDEWKQHDFSEYDSVLHVAGIAHIKETKENRELYYKVNRDLAFEVAGKSKNAGIPHFIFLSSMSIYGLETGVIDKETVPIPKNAYGKSKYEAEKLIKELEDEHFKVAIVRPPMIYGPDCPGNYARLSKLAKITPIFLEVKNQRSMIFVDNLSMVLERIISERVTDIVKPQNLELINTSKLVRDIAKLNGKRILMLKVPKLCLLKLNIPTLNSLFGNLYYEESNNLFENSKLESYENALIKVEKNH